MLLNFSIPSFYNKASNRTKPKQKRNASTKKPPRQGNLDEVGLFSDLMKL